MLHALQQFYTVIAAIVFGVGGVIAGHKGAVSKLKKAIKDGEIVVKADLPKAEHIAKHLWGFMKDVYEVPTVKAAVAPIEHKAEKALENSHALEVVQNALLGLMKFGKHLTEMNDAEKYALGQFVSSSLSTVAKSALTSQDIVNGINQAQKLLDSANSNPLLQKALELTGIAQAFQSQGTPQVSTDGSATSVPTTNTTAPVASTPSGTVPADTN